MPHIDNAVVRHLADLARLQLTEVEVEDLVSDLQVILSSIAKISEVVGPDVAATTNPIPATNNFREDVYNPAIHLTADEALSGAPEREGNYFKVPPIGEPDA
jgi:aspartyl-tRNA(Asn)/glutamyl-tRNA(Gln) amidotransferase subunit C